MGTVIHHTIIVTASYDHDEGGHWADVAYSQALVDFAGLDLVSPVVPGVVNDVRSFSVLPDGSKEGWNDSDAGDRARERFRCWLHEQAHEDGGSPIEWVEVAFGRDGGMPHVTDGSR